MLPPWRRRRRRHGEVGESSVTSSRLRVVDTRGAVRCGANAVHGSRFIDMTSKMY